MVRDYVRNGRGWSQPSANNNVNNGINGRKLPRPPHGAMNAMAALQGMLGMNQNNLSTMLNLNGSVNNINNSISNVSGITQPFGLMNSAVRRLPSVPAPGQLPAAPMTAVTAAEVQQQQQQQGSWISKLFKRGPSATPQQETNQRLQQQLLLNQQQSNLNQQQLLSGQQHLMQPGPVQHVVTPAPASVVSAQPSSVLPGQFSLPLSVSMNQIPLINSQLQPQQMMVSNLQPHLSQPQPLPLPVKKPGEGWGGRGARLPKVPVPLPSLPPNKSSGYSHSFEEIEEDLFLDRIVAVGRGSRKLPNPVDATKRPGKRLTRQNGVFKRGYSLDEDEYGTHQVIIH